MPADILPPSMSRRSFLKSAALAAGAALTAPLVAGAGSPQAAPLTISLLIPRSNLYPALGASLVLGVRRYLAEIGGQIAGSPVHLRTLPLGVGAEAAAAALARALEEGADLVAGVVSPEYASQLAPILQRHRSLFFAVDAGANLPRANEQNPLFIYNSLGVWQAAYALGAWAATHIGRRAAVALSFYESGYDAPYAFQLGFEQAGGQVQVSTVTHVPGHPTVDQRELWERLSASEPDLVYAAHSGSQALELVRGYQSSGLAGALPLLSSAFLVDEHLLPLHGPAAEGIRSALAYDGTPRLTLRPAGTPDGPHPVEGFALLGYETASAIAAALEASGGDPRDPARMREGLASAPLASLRGPLSVDPDAATVGAPLHLRAVSGRDGLPGLRSVAMLPAISTGDGAVAELRATPRTGWLHSYLCI